MKIKSLFYLVALVSVFASSASFAQSSVVIRPKKIVYTRKGKVSMKDKRTFNVTYPIVSGAISPATKKKLENTISYWRVFESSLQENLTEYDWLTDAYYKVNYNKNGILDIELTQEGVAAYPDGRTVDLVIDLKTGEQMKFADAFKKESLGKFAEMVNEKLNAEKNEIIASIRADKDSYSNEEDRKRDVETLSELKFTIENFQEFSISDEGVTILYDAKFPHVIQALEPGGRYFFTWTEAKPFIKSGGLLARFVR